MQFSSWQNLGASRRTAALDRRSATFRPQLVESGWRSAAAGAGCAEDAVPREAADVHVWALVTQWAHLHQLQLIVVAGAGLCPRASMGQRTRLHNPWHRSKQWFAFCSPLLQLKRTKRQQTLAKNSEDSMFCKNPNVNGPTSLVSDATTLSPFVRPRDSYTVTI